MPKINGMAFQVKAAVPKPNDLSVIPNIHIVEIRPTLSSHSLTSTHAPTYIHITPKEKNRMPNTVFFSKECLHIITKA